MIDGGFRTARKAISDEELQRRAQKLAHSIGIAGSPVVTRKATPEELQELAGIKPLEKEIYAGMSWWGGR